MKSMKKLFSLALVLLMILSLTVTAAATITDSNANLTGHTYKAYKIFAGTQAADSNKLAVTGWGDGVNGPALLAALQANDAFEITIEGEGDEPDTIENAFAGLTSAAAVAEALAANTKANDDVAKAFARAFARVADQHIVSANGIAVVNGQSDLAAGYYLVRDVTENTSGENQAVNLSLLQMTKVGTFDIGVKVDVPEVTKKVDDKNDSNTSEDTTSWYDSADHDIGDSVSFQLTATMPSDLANYSTYKIVFHDTMSAGLSYNNDMKVYVVNGTTETEATTGWTYSATTAGFDVTVNDVFALKGAENAAINVTKDSKIVVRYSATLNDDAVIGYQGNPNQVTLEYSNNPNWIPPVVDPDNPPENPEEPPTGKTPPDKVVVFTYALKADKVDESGAALAGAGFTLYKWEIAENKWVAVGEEITGKTTFEFKGIDAGDYKLVETTVPAGYNKAADVEFTITAESDLVADDPKLTKLEINKTSITAEQAIDGENSYYTGYITTSIENKPGTVLPETGGTGTTIFYIVGGLLVAAAVVLLVTKKRMASAE